MRARRDLPHLLEKESIPRHRVVHSCSCQYKTVGTTERRDQDCRIDKGQASRTHQTLGRKSSYAVFRRGSDRLQGKRPQVNRIGGKVDERDGGGPEKE